MKDYISFDLDSRMTPEEIFAILASALPTFQWRKGDSDSQGPYISGISPEQIQIKLWLGEEPFQGSISLTGVWTHEPDREQRKERFVRSVLARPISSIGTIVAVSGLSSQSAA